MTIETQELNFLTVYDTNLNKIRIGSNNDGGYAILDGLKYDLLISCGVSDDINFENEFVQKYNVFCLAFDGTINNIPEHNRFVKVISKNISDISTEHTTNLHGLFETFDNIFLKMDIESYEYQWLDSLSFRQLNKISQFVIEFHFPTSTAEHLEMTKNFDTNQKLQIIERLCNTHVLTHLHPNNCCGFTLYNGVKIPNVFECTFIRKDLCQIKSQTNDPIPNNLYDSKNLDWLPEIELNCQPYTNFK